jgi:ankyrin repeat protein
LLEHGANIEYADDNGTRPIDYATLLNHDEWREFMLSRGATP